MKVVGWALVGTDGNPTEGTGVSKTKKNLLIGCDMVPLRGLEECENWLRSEKTIPTEVEIAVNSKHHHGFAPVINGIPDIDMMDYGAFGTTEKSVLDSVVLYLFDGYKGRGVERFHTTNEEQNICNAFTFFEAIKVKGTTRKKALEKLKSEVAAIFGRTKITIEGVELKLQEGDEKL